MKKVIAFTANLALFTSLAYGQDSGVVCRDLKIFSNDNATEFIKITPTQEKVARFEVCSYQDSKYCRPLGQHLEYKTTEFTYRTVKQYAKGGAMIALELGAIGGVSLLAGTTAYLMTGGIAYNSPYAFLITEKTGYAVMALVAGASAYAVSATNVLNPMNHFRNGVAINDLKQAILNKKCAISVELNEKEMIERMESVMENFDRFQANSCEQL